mmetsp:Transcript_27357/g.36309  ORF Transcript_27357/g.36309 Transcript_27357/m.36309 type:complete len:106 (-) Transcript_27357:1198-1515(-)
MPVFLCARILLAISLISQTMFFVNSEPCAQLMKNDITGTFQPYFGTCMDADIAKSMYVKKDDSKNVYRFYHLERNRWYFDAAGYNSCRSDYKNQLSTEFEGGIEP